jgi:hypothetical protein
MKVIDNVKIEDLKVDEKEKNYEISNFITECSLTEDQIDRLRTEFFNEFEAIGDERNEAQVVEKWKSLQNQYDGVLAESEDRQFNLHRHITKVKCDYVTRAIMQALSDTDTKFSITPRPEFAKVAGYDVCQKQEDWLDYSLDNRIEWLPVKSLVVHSAVLKGTGIQKNIYDIRTIRNKREEKYEGKPEVIIDQASGQPVGMRNQGLEAFIRAHKEEIEENPKDYEGYIKDLTEGKKIRLMVEYDEIVYDDPYPQYVALENFFVRLSAKGYNGLCQARGVFERRSFTYWELKEEEKKGVLKNIDELKYEHKLVNKKPTRGELRQKYEKETFNILEAEFQFDIKGDEKRNDKLLVWFDEKDKIFLGAVYFPWIGLQSQYNPHYIKIKNDGFYQPGIAEDLTDNNIAQDALLSFYLEAQWIANLITPIVKEDSGIYDQMMAKQFRHGMPLVLKKTEDASQVRFFNELLRPVDTNGLVTSLQLLSKDADDTSRVSDLTTGRASEIDPSAPASKTIALLEQSGIGVKDYIQTIAPSWNRDGWMFLQLYGQMSEEERRFQGKTSREEAVTGSDPFGMITREDMVAKTNIQTLVTAFDFDKMNEKRIDLAMFQLLSNEMLVRGDPKRWYEVVRQIVKGWSPKWRSLVDRVLPTPEQVTKEMALATLQGVKQYMDLKVAESQQMGTPMNISADQLVPMVKQLVGAISLPPQKESK